jgi:hypothetical protein
MRFQQSVEQFLAVSRICRIRAASLGTPRMLFGRAAGFFIQVFPPTGIPAGEQIKRIAYLSLVHGKLDYLGGAEG